MGPLEPGHSARAGSDRRSSEIRRHYAGHLSAQRHDPRRGRPHRLGARSRIRSANCSATGSRRERADRAAGKLAGPKIEHLLDHESNQTQIGIAYDSVPYRHPDYFQAWGAVGVLSGGMSSRLFTEVREKRGPVLHRLRHDAHAARSRRVLCYAGTSAERAQETLDVTLGELVRLAEGIEAGRAGPAQGPHQERLIMQQESSSARSSARSPATGITWAACARSTKSAGWSTR